jgi:predicted RNA-binding protein with TRAM domain
MGAVIHTTATNAGDSVKLMVAESYDEVIERLRAAAASPGGLAEVTQQHDGARVALVPAQVVFVREPRA